ncbi:hypothetical protein MLD38_018878 [Melastoma candidum]|uniref:Uncharacterized protein n=1 Tax=Melastoma candidum TaxID=119954 RepID=A0ACB9QUE0_9MYRT|nr:hypothetical protein MLD38_018878 [Melastoma candidum]
MVNVAEAAQIPVPYHQSVVGVLTQPCSKGNRMLIAYKQGLLVLWDISRNQPQEAIILRMSDNVIKLQLSGSQSLPVIVLHWSMTRSQNGYGGHLFVYDFKSSVVTRVGKCTVDADRTLSCTLSKLRAQFSKMGPAVLEFRIFNVQFAKDGSRLAAGYACGQMTSMQQLQLSSKQPHLLALTYLLIGKKQIVGHGIFGGVFKGLIQDGVTELNIDDIEIDEPVLPTPSSSSQQTKPKPLEREDRGPQATVASVVALQDKNKLMEQAEKLEVGWGLA